jgi:hypothetical protein
MSRSFGPVVIVDPKTNDITRIHCHFCIFNDYRPSGRVCSHVDRSNPRQIDNPDETPDWCQMKADAIRDTLDMVNGVEHTVVRWSGRKTADPRDVFTGIPSEAARQFRLASRKAKRGSVWLEDQMGTVLDKWPEAVA